MWLISPTLTLVMLLIIPPISIGSFFYGRFIRGLSLKTQEAMGNMSKLAEERLSAHRTVTASNTQPAEETLYAGRVGKVYGLQKKETFANGIFQGANEVAGDLGMIGLLIYGGVLVKRGEISVGDMTSLFIYVNWIEWSLNSEFPILQPSLFVICRVDTRSETHARSSRRLFHWIDEGCRCFSANHRPSRRNVSDQASDRDRRPAAQTRNDRAQGCDICVSVQAGRQGAGWAESAD